jgi:hypothetical protein
MIKRSTRILLSTAIVSISLSAGLLGYGYWYINHTLNKLSIERWSINLQSLSAHHVMFEQVAFNYSALPIGNTITAHHAVIDWQWNGWRIPQIKQITIDKLDISLDAHEASSGAPVWDGAIALPMRWPQTVDFSQIFLLKAWQLQMPCASGACVWSGQVVVDPDENGIHLTLKASPDEVLRENHVVTLTAHYQIQQNLPQLNINVSLDEKPIIKAHTQLLMEQSALTWKGDIDVTLNYPDAWWLNQLTQRGIRFDKNKLGKTTDKITAQISWNTPLTVKETTQHYWVKALPLIVKWQLSGIDIAREGWQTLLPTPLPLLSFTKGSVEAGGEAYWDVRQPQALRSQTTVKLKDVSGIYDTTEFAQLNATAVLQTERGKMKISFPSLKVESITKGLAIEKLDARATYEASLTQPAKGMLTLQALQARFLGGQITTSSNSKINFTQAQQQLTLQLKAIDLQQIFEQYPESDLSGSGYLSGVLPLTLSDKGVSVTDGQLAAENGGVIRYRSPKAAALASSAIGMAMMVKALDDFHYTLLKTTADYDTSGKLLLGVSLEGKNPQIENGRPVHLNIHLEENVPALLTSVQLSGQISDGIQKRIEQKQRRQP